VPVIVWAYHRRGGEGIVPVVRRGPYSFLAWLEIGIDRGLALIESVYRGIADEARQWRSGG
jgi:hypothetical protein